MNTTAIDYAPLSRRPTTAQRAAVRGEARSGAFGKTTAEATRTSTRSGIVLTVVLGGFLTLIVGIVALVQWAKDDDPSTGGIATAFVAAVVVVVYLLGRLVGRRTWRRTVQVIAFARANDFDVQPQATPSKLPGSVSRYPKRTSHTSNRIRWEQDGHQVESARFESSSSGTETSSDTVHYLAVQLGVGMPKVTFGCGRRIGTRVDLRFGTDILADDAVLPKHRRPRLVCGTPRSAARGSVRGSGRSSPTS